MRYISPKQAAKICGVPVSTIYYWVKEGRLEAKRMTKGSKLYILEKDIPTYLRRNEK